MKRFLVIATAMMALSAPAFAQTGSAEQQVRNLDKQAREAAIHGDSEFEAQYTASDYMSISASGAVSTREQTLARVRSGDIKLSSIDVDEEQVRVYGDTAVVTGRVHVLGAVKGQAIDHKARYTRVWVRQSGAWKLVAFQETTIAPAGS
jgi:ketosteroid isomerase-like protein